MFMSQIQLYSASRTQSVLCYSILTYQANQSNTTDTEISNYMITSFDLLSMHHFGTERYAYIIVEVNDFI